MSCDPDAQVQQVVRLSFRKCDALGTVHGVWRSRGEQGIELGVRIRTGPAQGGLEWRRPSRMTLQNGLKNPM